MGETEDYWHCKYCFIHKSAFCHFPPCQHSCEGLPSDPKAQKKCRGGSEHKPGLGQIAVAVLLTVLSLGKGLHAKAQINATEVSLKNVPLKCHRYALK